MAEKDIEYFKKEAEEIKIRGKLTQAKVEAWNDMIKYLIEMEV